MEHTPQRQNKTQSTEAKPFAPQILSQTLREHGSKVFSRCIDPGEIITSRK